jgi:hypothetical protein
MPCGSSGAATGSIVLQRFNHNAGNYETGAAAARFTPAIFFTNLLDEARRR